MDAGTELIQAMFDTLRATTALTDIVGDRIYDRVPEDPVSGEVSVPFPYMSLGPSVSIPDDYDCMMGESITVQWDAWTNGDGDSYASVTCRKICDIVKRTLHDAELALTNNALVTLQCVMVRVLNDPNPAIGHGVVQFTAVIETP